MSKDVTDFMESVVAKVREENAPPVTEEPKAPETQAQAEPNPPVQTPEPQQPAPKEDPVQPPAWQELARKAEIEAENEERFVEAVKSFKKKASEPPPEIPDPFDGDQSMKKFVEWKKNGGDPKAFWEFQVLDVDQLAKDNPDALLFLDRKIRESYLTDDQIRKLISHEFNTNPEDINLDETTLELNEIRKIREIVEASSRLKEWKAEQAIPLAERQRMDEARKLDLAIEEYNTRLNRLPTELEFKVDGKGYKVTPAPTSIQAAKDPNSFFQRFNGPDGSLDPAKVLQAAYILDHYQEIAKLAAKDHVAPAVKEIVEKIENPSNPSSVQTQTPSGPKTERDMVREMAENLFKKR